MTSYTISSFWRNHYAQSKKAFWVSMVEHINESSYHITRNGVKWSVLSFSAIPNKDNCGIAECENFRGEIKLFYIHPFGEEEVEMRKTIIRKRKFRERKNGKTD